MSVQAITWVLEDAPNLPAHLVGTLLALANHADRNGKGAYPGQATIAWYTRKTDRAIRKDLIQLSKLGLIREGDQRLVRHLPGDERPVVYDLAMEAKRAPRPARDRNSSSGRKPRGTGTPVPPPDPEGPEPEFRAEPQFRPELQGQRDRNSRVRGTGTGVPTNRPLNRPGTSSSSSSSPIDRIAAALGEEEEEAQQIYDRVIAERSPRAPGRYIDALIASGDIAQFRTSAPKPTTNGYTGPTHPFTADRGGQCADCGLPATHPRHGDQP